MGYRKYYVVSGVIFSLVALAHLLRIVYGMSVQVDDFAVPMSVSWMGLFVTASLAFWAFRLSRRTHTAEAFKNTANRRMVPIKQLRNL